MKIGIIPGASKETGKNVDMPLVLEAERLGFDSAWTSEA